MAKQQQQLVCFPLFSIFWCYFYFLMKRLMVVLDSNRATPEESNPFHFRGSKWNPNHPRTTKPSKSMLSHEGWIFTKRSCIANKRLSGTNHGAYDFKTALVDLDADLY